jgi:cyclopropane-fatty-acyl-phospholipid synthase
VRATGVTLSQEQAAWAQEEVRRRRLQGQVTIRIQDYRDVGEQEPFDAVASVGMVEHVGLQEMTGYFRKVHGMLRSGGLFLNHGIGTGWVPRPNHGPSFIDSYIFPDTELLAVDGMLAHAAAGGFEIRDVENLREHYVLTLCEWRKRLESSWERASELVTEAVTRAWRVYLAGSAHSFRRGQLAVYQTLLAKLDVNGWCGLPLEWRSK